MATCVALFLLLGSVGLSNVPRAEAATPPASVHDFTGAAQLGDVACPSPSTCVAVGRSRVNSGEGAALVEVITDGVPGPLQPVPGGANIILTDVACPSADWCLGIGNDENVATGGDSDADVAVPIVDGAPQAPRVMPKGMFQGHVLLNEWPEGVACPGVDDCIFTGQGEDAQGNLGGATLSYSDGSFGTVELVPGLALVEGIACSDATTCEVVGNGGTPNEGAAATLVNGAPSGAPQYVPSASSLDDVACSTGACLAIGHDSDDPETANLVVAPVGGAAAKSATVVPNSTENQINVGGLACASADLCEIVGRTNGPAGAVLTVRDGVPGQLRSVPYALGKTVCSTPTTCVALGSNDIVSTDTSPALIESITDGIPAPVQFVEGGRGHQLQSSDLSCGSPTACSVVGDDTVTGVYPSYGFATTIDPTAQPTPTCEASLPAGSVIGSASTGDGQGYWIATSSGAVTACGDAPDFGDWSDPPAPVTAITAAPSGEGFYLAASDGVVKPFGNATFQGPDVPGRLNKPIVGMVADPATGGYWEVAADGGVFAYNTPFYGSASNLTLTKPVVGMASTPDGKGYWLVAADGGIFAYGDAHFYGSAGNLTLAKPVVGMDTDPATGGYWLVAADGGIFSYHAPFHGSAGNLTLTKPVVGMATYGNGSGYRLVASDGGIFNYNAPFDGSAA